MKKKLSKLKKQLTGLCKGPDTALWFSGGSDSRFLLEAISEWKLNCTLLRFDDGWSKEQKSHIDTVIGKHRIAAYSWKPHSVMLFGENGEFTASAEYAVGRNGESIPILRDIVDGDRCSFDVPMVLRESIYPPVLIKNHIIGSKKSDRHFAFGDGSVIRGSRFELGAVNFFAPLYSWSDGEVLRALKETGVDWVEPEEHLDTGNLAACTKCLRGVRVECPKTGKEIEPVNWSPEDNLKIWRKRHGVIAV